VKPVADIEIRVSGWRFLLVLARQTPEPTTEVSNVASQVETADETWVPTFGLAAARNHYQPTEAK
jgi:hypothetical protein